MAKEAKIKCPHCGLPITVRRVDKGLFEETGEILEQVGDNILKTVDAVFKKLFK